MKTFIMIFFALLLLLFYEATYAKVKSAKIKYQHKFDLHEIGQTAQGEGSSKSESFYNASVDCYNKREQAYVAKHGSISEERALDLIDSCANMAY